MPVFKNESNGTWYVMARYVNWKGERKQKCKRGFSTKKEAQEWERMFQLQNSSDMDMSFEAFTELYIRDMKSRLKENTWLTKEHIIRTKILPYFGKLKISEISTKEVIAWQNEMLAYRDEKKKPYSQTYLKTLHNQLSAIFNHAVRYYELRSEAPQLAFRIGGVLGFKGFLRLGELSPVFRGRGQFPGSQVTGDEALGAEFTYQDGLAFRGDGLVQVIIRTAFYKRRDSIAAYVEMGRKGRGLRNCHDESKDQRLIYLRRSGAFCQFRSVEAVPWRPHSAGTRLEEGENLVSRKPEEGLFLPASREPPGRASGW